MSNEKNEGVEKEKKYLLKNDSWKKGVANKDTIYQAYVSWDKIKVEVKGTTLKVTTVDGFKMTKPISEKEARLLTEHLHRDEKVFRIRNKSGKLLLTIKIDIGIVGEQVEVEPTLNEEEFKEFEKHIYSYVSKVRNYVKVGKHVFEIDEFKKKNADREPLAEIELNDLNEEHAIPDWLGVEVTGDPRYFNETIARENM